MGHRRCHGLPLPSRLRHRPCLDIPLPSRLSHRRCLVARSKGIVRAFDHRPQPGRGRDGQGCHTGDRSPPIRILLRGHRRNMEQGHLVTDDPYTHASVWQRAAIWNAHNTHTHTHRDSANSCTRTCSSAWLGTSWPGTAWLRAIFDTTAAEFASIPADYTAGCSDAHRPPPPQKKGHAHVQRDERISSPRSGKMIPPSLDLLRRCVFVCVISLSLYICFHTGVSCERMVCRVSCVCVCVSLSLCFHTGFFHVQG